MSFVLGVIIFHLVWTNVIIQNNVFRSWHHYILFGLNKRDFTIQCLSFWTSLYFIWYWKLLSKTVKNKSKSQRTKKPSKINLRWLILKSRKKNKINYCCSETIFWPVFVFGSFEENGIIVLGLDKHGFIN